MSRILLLVFLVIKMPCDIFSQVAYGKKSIDGSGMVDFAQDSGRGLILPIVEQLPTIVSNGTLLVLKQDSSVYVYEDSTWLQLSKNGKLPLNFITISGAENDSTIIGAKLSSASGVLILESSNKALILPKNATTHVDIKSPRIGTISYDKTYKSIAVYDGNRWIYWK